MKVSSPSCGPRANHHVSKPLSGEGPTRLASLDHYYNTRTGTPWRGSFFSGALELAFTHVGTLLCARPAVSRASGWLATNRFSEVPFGMVGGRKGASGRLGGYARVTWEWARSIIIAGVLFLGVRAFLISLDKVAILHSVKYECASA